jgi:hypothetical protein
LTREASDDFQFQSCKHLDGVWLLNQLWRQLQLEEILNTLFASRHHQIPLERLIFAMVANRALHPSSKLAMEEWGEKDVHIPHLPEVTSHQLYRAMEELLIVQSDLERQVLFFACKKQLHRAPDETGRGEASDLHPIGVRGNCPAVAGMASGDQHVGHDVPVIRVSAEKGRL